MTTIKEKKLKKALELTPDTPKQFVEWSVSLACAILHKLGLPQTYYTNNTKWYRETLQINRRSFYHMMRGKPIMVKDFIRLTYQYMPQVFASLQPSWEEQAEHWAKSLAQAIKEAKELSGVCRLEFYEQIGLGPGVMQYLSEGKPMKPLAMFEATQKFLPSYLLLDFQNELENGA